MLEMLSVLKAFVFLSVSVECKRVASIITAGGWTRRRLRGLVERLFAALSGVACATSVCDVVF